MWKKILPFLLIAVLLIHSPALGQAPLSISQLEIDLWPEYDAPGVLVLYRITLAPETTFPQELSFRIPRVVGNPNAIAVKQPNDQLFTVDYGVELSGDYQIITFSTTLPEIQLEYYDSRLEQQDGQHSFTYEWPGDYEVTSMVVQIQQPFEANAMVVSPGPVSGFPGSDGLSYFTKEIGAVSANQKVEIGFTYMKNTDNLSIENLRVQSTEPLAEKSAWPSDLQNYLPWILAFLGISLIVGGGLWYWQSGKQGKPAKQRRRSRSPREETTIAGVAQGVYCHQCGKRAASGDQFCRSCGTKLRIE